MFIKRNKEPQKIKNYISKQPYKGLTGYSLQAKRLSLFTKQESIKTIKFPLYLKNLQTIKIISDKIKNDYNICKGAVNLTTFNEYNQKGKNFYSLMNFWVDCLRAGVIFNSSVTKTTDLIYKINKKQTPSETLFNNIPENLRNKLDKDKTIENIISKNLDFRTTSTRNSLIRKFTTCFNCKDFEELSQDNKDLVLQMTDNALYKNKQFWKDTFNLDFSNNQDEIKSKISFYIIPNIEFDKEQKLSPFELTVRLKKYIIEQNILKPNEDKIFQELLGLDSSFNALSNFWNEQLKYLRQNNIQKIIEELTIFSDINIWNSNNIDELKQRLQFLSECANKLPQTVIDDESKYRTFVGGAISSWYSNYKNQLQNIKTDLDNAIEDNTNLQEQNKKQTKNKKQGGHKQILEKINNEFIEKYYQKYLDKLENDSEHCTYKRQDLDDLKLELQDLISELLNLNKQIIQNYDSLGQIPENLFELYRINLAIFRQKINNFYQNFAKEFIEEQEGENKASNYLQAKYKSIFNNLKKLSNFYAESKQQQYIKFNNSAKIIEQGLVFLNNLEIELNQYKNNFNFTLEDLQKLLNILFIRYKNNGFNSSYYSDIVKNLVQDILNNYLSNEQQFEKQKILEKNNHWVFYKNARSQDKRLKKINLENIKDINLEIFEILDKLKTDTGLKFLNNDINKLVDKIEIEKIRFGILLKLLPENKSINIQKEKLDKLETAYNYLDFYKLQTLDKIKLQNFLQAFIFADLKGCTNLISKKEFIERYVNQVMKSEEKFKLIYIPKNENKDFTEILKQKDLSLLSKEKHNWGIYFNEKEKAENNNTIKALVISGKKDKLQIKQQQINVDFIANIQTSKYQIHFLEKLLTMPKKWNNLKIDMSSLSLILEQNCKIHWDFNNQTNTLNLNNEIKIYTAIPFNVSNKKNVQTSLIKEPKDLKRFVGLDIGEYGIAYSILDFADEKNPKIIKKGFWYSPEIRKIKTYVENIKSTQLKGTFSMASTKLARIRENAVYSLKSKIHDLVVNYKARPIYESSISNFETGSNRVTKVYKTLKTSDVFAENDADKAIAKQVWGTNKLIGNHISAYGTSQTCSKCHKCILNKVQDKELYEIIEIIEGFNIFVVKIENKKCFLYDDKSHKINEQINGKQVKQFAYAFMRPPLHIDKDNKELSNVFKFLKSKYNKDILTILGDKLNDWKNIRGNSAIFVCPFCLHISDADIQASANIALRGFIASQLPKSSQKVDENSEIKYDKFINENNINLQIINLD